jgi:cellulase/cellobiase CelA1
MTLTGAEHQRVKREAMDARNARARYRRAQRWCADLGVEVRPWRTPFGNPQYTLHAPGFHPVTSDTLEGAVAALDATISTWCESPTATHGPTGAKLDRLRAARGR